MYGLRYPLITFLSSSCLLTLLAYLVASSGIPLKWVLILLVFGLLFVLAFISIMLTILIPEINKGELQ